MAELQSTVTQPFTNIENSFFYWVVRNDSAHQLYKFDTNRITNSKMANKMAAVQSKITAYRRVNKGIARWRKRFARWRQRDLEIYN